MCHPAVFTAIGMSTSAAGVAAAIAPTVISAGGAVLLGIQQSEQAEASAKAIAKVKEEELKDNVLATYTSTLQSENIRRQNYFDNLATNDAYFSNRGITPDSGQIRALLKSNKNIKKKELRASNLSFTAKLANYSYDRQSIELEKQASLNKADSDYAQSLLKGYTGAATIAREFDTTESPKLKTTDTETT